MSDENHTSKILHCSSTISLKNDNGNQFMMDLCNCVWMYVEFAKAFDHFTI